MLIPPSQPLCCRVPPPTALTKAVSPRLGCAVVSLPSELCSRRTSLALSVLNLGHPPSGQDETGTSHPPSTLVGGSSSSIPHMSEPAWHHPSETHLFWSWKWESNHNPEAEPALRSPSGFSAALPALGRSVLVPQSLLCNDAKAKPGRGTGTGGVASAEPVSGGGWSW